MNSTGLVLPQKVYDISKHVVQIVLPAVATLYAALGSLWGWLYILEIVGTITALTAFFGIVLGISSANYTKQEAQRPLDGDLLVAHDGESEQLLIQQFNLERDPSTLRSQDIATFRIKSIS